jgi:hypothetical protein
MRPIVSDGGISISASAASVVPMPLASVLPAVPRRTGIA